MCAGNMGWGGSQDLCWNSVNGPAWRMNLCLGTCAGTGTMGWIGIMLFVGYASVRQSHGSGTQSSAQYDKHAYSAQYAKHAYSAH